MKKGINAEIEKKNTNFNAEKKLKKVFKEKDTEKDKKNNFIGKKRYNEEKNKESSENKELKKSKNKEIENSKKKEMGKEDIKIITEEIKINNINEPYDSKKKYLEDLKNKEFECKKNLEKTISYLLELSNKSCVLWRDKIIFENNLDDENTAKKLAEIDDIELKRFNLIQEKRKLLEKEKVLKKLRKFVDEKINENTKKSQPFLHSL